MLQGHLVPNIHSICGKVLWLWKDWSWDFNRLIFFQCCLEWQYSVHATVGLILVNSLSLLSLFWKKYNKSRLMLLSVYVHVSPPLNKFEFLNQSLWNLAHVSWHLSPSQWHTFSQIHPISNTNTAASLTKPLLSCPTAILTSPRCTPFWRHPGNTFTALNCFNLYTILVL
jgi:hypothetical protein